MTDSELYHHGILGMKWGVRRYEDSNGHLTSAGKKRYAKYNDNNSNNEFAKESDKQIKINSDGSKTVPKGFMMNRVGKSNIDINQSGALYTSYGKADAARYIKQMGPTTLNKLLRTSSETVQHISVKEDLKMPSDEEVAIQTAKLLSNDKKLLESFNDSIYSVTASDSNEITSKELNEALKNPSGKAGQKLAYSVSSFLGNGAYAEESKAVYNHFRKSGYDALPDLHDRLGGTSQTAMIIINPNKISLDSTTTITKDVLKSGKEYLKTVEKLTVNELIKS